MSCPSRPTGHLPHRASLAPALKRSAVRQAWTSDAWRGMEGRESSVVVAVARSLHSSSKKPPARSLRRQSAAPTFSPIRVHFPCARWPALTPCDAASRTRAEWVVAHEPLSPIPRTGTWLRPGTLNSTTRRMSVKSPPSSSSPDTRWSRTAFRRAPSSFASSCTAKGNLSAAGLAVFQKREGSAKPQRSHPQLQYADPALRHCR